LDTPSNDYALHDIAGASYFQARLFEKIPVVEPDDSKKSSIQVIEVVFQIPNEDRAYSKFQKS
jgi:hypothetical protein